jgi:hypothetical protein
MNNAVQVDSVQSCRNFLSQNGNGFDKKKSGEPSTNLGGSIRLDGAAAEL